MAGIKVARRDHEGIAVKIDIAHLGWEMHVRKELQKAA